MEANLKPPMHAYSALRLDWSVASRPFPGQQTSGDLSAVVEWPGGVLVAVVDGLGHGEQAALAAQRAVDTVTAHPREPLVALIRRCHGALAGTRGVVMSVAALDLGRSRMSWIGVGNVEGRLLRASGGQLTSKNLLMRGGVVGHDLPSLLVSVVAVMPGDLLILATDGVSPDFAASVKLGEPPQRLADRILAEYGRDTDDGLALVARYRGS